MSNKHAAILLAKADERIAGLESENARLKAAHGHMQQEIAMLRSREMCVDDIADYIELRDRLMAENARLKKLACWQEDDTEPATVEWAKSEGLLYVNIVELFDEWAEKHRSSGPSPATKGQLRRMSAALERK